MLMPMAMATDHTVRMADLDSNGKAVEKIGSIPFAGGVLARSGKFVITGVEMRTGAVATGMEMRSGKSVITGMEMRSSTARQKLFLPGNFRQKLFVPNNFRGWWGICHGVANGCK